jgi:hypothetical protein
VILLALKRQVLYKFFSYLKTVLNKPGAGTGTGNGTEAGTGTTCPK